MGSWLLIDWCYFWESLALALVRQPSMHQRRSAPTRWRGVAGLWTTLLLLGPPERRECVLRSYRWRIEGQTVAYLLKSMPGLLGQVMCADGHYPAPSCVDDALQLDARPGRTSVAWKQAVVCLSHLDWY